MKKAKNEANTKKVYCPSALFSGRKKVATRKLAVQLAATAMELAFPRALEGKISETKNHGMEPGPVAKETTKSITKTIDA